MRVEEAVIPPECIEQAAGVLIAQIGEKTIQEKVGGKNWWRWRVKELKAEWIEMKKDYKYRKAHPEEAKRTMFYVHGGAYFFSSVNTHRYQLQRHARKLKARVFARMSLLTMLPSRPYIGALIY